LGTTIGMPGCTCVWPVLLVMFFVNAAGLEWGAADYLMLAVTTLVLSLGSAGVPGIAIVSSIAVFSALNLPIAAVVLLIPINTVSDMARTLNNVTAAAVSAAIVARKEGQLDDKVFNAEEAVTQ
ncbi:MAG: cation:dicarboxylase symporter family transporter, partial [Oscillospiraceae bacterium]|nr:cation:dicarboxylase symporter family transporter [Oscillospiraceae bacterium]